jgi:hypothetical protein
MSDDKVRFDSLGLGDMFMTGGRVYEMTGSDRAKRLVNDVPDDAYGAGFDPWQRVTKLDVVTSHDYPPIPIRCFDWCAHLDSYDGAPDSGHQPMGQGPTRRAALVELAQDLEDNYEEDDES